MYDVPQQRRELIEERIPQLRDQYLTLQRRLQVDDLQWLRFMEVVAEQELGSQAARVAEDRRRIAEVLGEPHALEVQRFRESDPERRNLRTLQEALPENQRLGEEQAEAAVARLAKFRDDTVRRMSAAETPVGVFLGTRGGSLLYDRNLATPDARIESATNYSRQLRDQARKQLSGSLLTAFNRQQEALLEQMRASEERSARRVP